MKRKNLRKMFAKMVQAKKYKELTDKIPNHYNCRCRMDFINDSQERAEICKD